MGLRDIRSEAEGRHVQADPKNMSVWNWSHWIENSGQQFWKRLRCTKDCNAGRRRRREAVGLILLSVGRSGGLM
jgi:hypothetical protein